ncbi:hypothetical protein B4099_0357 [Heyndrickxia coagulans]|uniref:Uncharacterized protein n=1 Tax=Heyndrickxia coagulans TaxID=1398 RepID=A0A150K772_HEYCO|nr:hypothetical protein B4099_0357 [Heyndrickxia coagulans]
MQKVKVIFRYYDDLYDDHFTCEHDAIIIGPNAIMYVDQHELNFTYLHRLASPNNGVLEVGQDDERHGIELPAPDGYTVEQLANMTIAQLGSLLADWRSLIC